MRTGGWWVTVTGTVALVKIGLRLACVVGVGHVPADVAGGRVAEDVGVSDPACLGVPGVVRTAVPAADGLVFNLVVGSGAAALGEIGDGGGALGGEEGESGLDVLLPVPYLFKGGRGCGELAHAVAVI